MRQLYETHPARVTLLHTSDKCHAGVGANVFAHHPQRASEHFEPESIVRGALSEWMRGLAMLRLTHSIGAKSGRTPSRFRSWLPDEEVERQRERHHATEEQRSSPQ